MYVTDYLETEVGHLGGAEIGAKKVFIGGFADGANIAITTHLLFKGATLGGVVGCSGFFGTVIEYDNINIEEKKNTPIYLQHGEADPCIPEPYA